MKIGLLDNYRSSAFVWLVLDRFRQTHADYTDGKFGDPTHPQVIRLYGWYASAAKQIEQAIAAEEARLTKLATPMKEDREP